MVQGPDATVLARGSVQARALPPSPARVNVTHAHVRLHPGIALEVFSVRLYPPPVVRIDLWSPDAWKAYRDARRSRREQTRYLAMLIERIPPWQAVLVGGDFNAPAGDAIFRLLAPRLRDTFRDAGTGWPNTALNEFPVVRIDQIWASEHFRAATVLARRTAHSDHRIVIADLIYRGPFAAASAAGGHRFSDRTAVD